MRVTGSDKSNEMKKRLRMLTVILLLVGLVAKTLVTQPSNTASSNNMTALQETCSVP